MYMINMFGYYDINPIQVYDLSPSNQKSYYGKAKIIKDENGKIFLQSYDTLVCYIDNDGKVKRIWDGYSSTTMKHINDFLRLFDLPGGGKKWWNLLPVEKH